MAQKNQSKNYHTTFEFIEKVDNIGLHTYSPTPLCILRSTPASINCPFSPKVGLAIYLMNWKQQIYITAAIPNKPWNIGNQFIVIQIYYLQKQKQQCGVEKKKRK